MKKRIPVTIRGTTYPSLYAAAKALNLAYSTIWHAKKHNRLETVGTQPSKPLTSDPVPIQIGPYLFPSIGAAARACKTTRTVISYRLEQGRLDVLLPLLESNQ